MQSAKCQTDCFRLIRTFHFAVCTLHFALICGFAALSLYDLGYCLRENGESEEAEKVWSECLEVVRGTVGIEHPRASVLIVNYSDLLAETGQPEQSSDLINEALTAIEKRYGRNAPWRVELLAVSAKKAVESRQYELAAAIGEEVIANIEARVKPLDRNDGFDLAHTAWALGELPDLTLCRKLYVRLFALEERQKDLKSRWTDNLMFGRFLVEHKAYSEAEPYLREAVRLPSPADVQRPKEYGSRSWPLLYLGKVDWAAGRFADAEANFRAALVEDQKLGSKSDAIHDLFWLINLLISQQKYTEAAALVKQFSQLSDLSPVNRAWNLHMQATLSATQESPSTEKSVLDELEAAFGDSTVPDVAVYRARAVVLANADVARELARLNDLMSKGETSDSVRLARASCALFLEKTEVAVESLNQIASSPEVDSESLIRLLFTKLAVYRPAPTDMHWDDLRVAVEQGELFLENTKKLTNPKLSRYASANQLELRCWCQRIRRERKDDKN